MRRKITLTQLERQADDDALWELNREHSRLAQFIEEAATIEGITTRDIEKAVDRGPYSYMMCDSTRAAIRAAVRKAQGK